MLNLLHAGDFHAFPCSKGANITKSGGAVGYIFLLPQSMDKPTINDIKFRLIFSALLS
jgi:hypothetical protein